MFCLSRALQTLYNNSVPPSSLPVSTEISGPQIKNQCYKNSDPRKINVPKLCSREGRTLA